MEIPEYISLRESYAREAFEKFHGLHARWESASEPHRAGWFKIADWVINMLDDAHNRRDA